MKTTHTQTQKLLLWVVILVAATSLCGIGSFQKDMPHSSESSHAAFSCMLGSCDTLTSKSLSIPDTVKGFLCLLSLALLPLLFHLFYLEAPAQIAFLRDPHLHKRNAPRLYQLHATYLI